MRKANALDCITNWYCGIVSQLKERAPLPWYYSFASGGILFLQIRQNFDSYHSQSWYPEQNNKAISIARKSWGKTNVNSNGPPLGVGLGVFSNETLTWWPNWGRVSVCRMRSRRASAIEGCAGVVTGSHVAWWCRNRYNAKREFVFGLVLKAKRPAVVAVFFREVNAAIIPWIAVAAVAGLHGHERCPGSVRGGVLE